MLYEVYMLAVKNAKSEIESGKLSQYTHANRIIVFQFKAFLFSKAYKIAHTLTLFLFFSDMEKTTGRKAKKKDLESNFWLQHLSI